MIHCKPGGAIRTISVSLLAVAAITAGIFFARTRNTPDPEMEKPKVLEDTASLEALRSAGF
jgi:hypothetical protein